jgi:uncharacterized protein (TIGR03663 family)
MATEPIYTRPRTGLLLDRRLSLAAIDLHWAIFGAIMVLSVLVHLWALDVKAMHHDESIHAWMSWKAFVGRGGFNCGFTPQGDGVEAVARSSSVYCYDPVYHGPSLYALTVLMYFLFGDGDWQARMPMALAGIALVASAPMLTPYFGRRGMLIAAALLAFSPALLYYTRFARHDGLMVLWEFWMVLGIFRYVDTGRPRYLYLVAAATALAVATHELYYILFFIFGLFLIIRLMSELLPQRLTYGALLLGLLGTTAIIVIKAVAGDAIGSRNLIGILRGPSLLLFSGVLLGLLAVRVWDREPVVWRRLRALWFEERRVLFTALAVYAAIYVLLYSTFFAYPRGILDGAYAGLYYWWFTQHEYARGDQPWYYYLMQLPIYEPLAILASFAASFALFARNIPWPLAQRPGRFSAATGITSGPVAPQGAEETEAAERAADQLGWNEQRDAVRLGDSSDGARVYDMPDAPAVTTSPAPTRTLLMQMPTAPLLPVFLSFWFFMSVVAFSWAGEKMPWLLVHMALPANLLAAWAIGRMLDSVDWQGVRDRRAFLTPALLTLLLLALGVALWRLSGDASGLEAQARVLQGLVPLLVVGAAVYALLTLGSTAGAKPVLALCGATLAVLLGAYTLRASWLVNFVHPDTPVEPLIYVQTAPDVPLIVDELSELSIAQTRNIRDANNQSGGRSLPIIMDTELAWPLEWYMRNFTNLQRQNSEFFQNLTAGSLQVGDGDLAPVVMVYKPSLSQGGRDALEQSYTLKYDTVLNWWFPEGDKCRPQNPGYKSYYFNKNTPQSILTADSPRGCGQNAPTQDELHSTLAPLAHPFQRENWADVGRYLMFRTLPPGNEITGREMEVWVRNDLAGSGAVGTASSTVKLVAQRVIGTQGSVEGQLNEPRGVAVDSAGNLYVADTFNHRIQVFDPNGVFQRAFGSFGASDGQLYEPRGVAVDAAGNVYVADTWNARIVKFDAQGQFVTAWGEGRNDLGDGKKATETDATLEGNAREPLGFFGPRSVAVDSTGNVYIADTGNQRIVVTDSEGNFKYQWGYEGAALGAFDEPAGVAVDAAGNVYVADTWNGRVQVFGPDGSGQVGAQPIASFSVPGWQRNTYLDPSIGVSADGQVFTSVPSDNAVRWTDSAGTERLRWGGAGSDTASLNGPSGIASAPDGSVYVVDRANHRILHYRLPQ